MCLATADIVFIIVVVLTFTCTCTYMYIIWKANMSVLFQPKYGAFSMATGQLPGHMYM